MCPRPNSHRIFDRIVIVEIWGGFWGCMPNCCEKWWGCRDLVSQRHGTTTGRSLIWSGQNILREVNISGGTERVLYTLEPAGYGNLISQRRSGATTWYHSDALGSTRALTNSSGTTTDTYDARGNQLVKQIGNTFTTHTWDYENRLTLVQKAGTTTNTYTFDGDGKRVRIDDILTTTGRRLVWSGQNILREVNVSGGTERVLYTLEPAGYGNLISQRRSGTTTWYHSDALGSTRALTNSSGTTTDTYSYYAFGLTVISTGATENPFRWVGKLGYYYDLDRLAYYLRARPYSPKLARFLSYDPIGIAGGWNLFGYTGNRPLVMVDPGGWEPTPSPKPTLVKCNCACKEYGDVEDWTTPAFETFFILVPCTGEALDCCDKACSNHLRFPFDVCYALDVNPTGPATTPKCRWYVIAAPTNVACLDSCCSCHTDMGNTCDGIVRQGSFGGMGGPSIPTPMPEGAIPLSPTLAGSVAFGDGAGKYCYQATHEDILSCVKSRPVKKPYNVATNNCRHDISDTNSDCCLNGF